MILSENDYAGKYLCAGLTVQKAEKWNANACQNSAPFTKELRFEDKMIGNGLKHTIFMSTFVMSTFDLVRIKNKNVYFIIINNKSIHLKNIFYLFETRGDVSPSIISSWCWHKFNCDIWRSCHIWWIYVV